MSLSKESFDKTVEELTHANFHSEARVIRARRTGDETLVNKALERFWKHEREGYKDSYDTQEDVVIDALIAKHIG
jgi:hypothetical protein